MLLPPRSSIDRFKLLAIAGAICGVHVYECACVYVRACVCCVWRWVVVSEPYCAPQLERAWVRGRKGVGEGCFPHPFLGQTWQYHQRPFSSLLLFACMCMGRIYRPTCFHEQAVCCHASMRGCVAGFDN
eukprot:1161220-Pelagomonas_calceolata.AAC.9